MGFVHLDCHSFFSLLEGADGIEQLVDRAARYDMDALAITDTNGMYGAVPFYCRARKAGIKPILGVELRAAGGRAVVLARSLDGYGRLCRLVTARHLDADSFSLENSLIDSRDDVFIISDDENLLRGLTSRGPRSDVFVELRNYGDRRSVRRIERAANLAGTLGLRTVATNGVMFVSPTGYNIHRVLTAVREVSTVDALAAADLAHKEAWLKSGSAMTGLFARWPEAIAATRWIADRCNVDLPLGTPHFPEFGLPRGETAFSHLWKLAFAGLKTRYHPLRPELSGRLAHELDVINRLGFAPYFLVVWDIVQYARREGIPIVGRGSAANSLVSYALGITDADPFRYDLYFERFLNMSRSDCPDIDLDICWRRRDDVIEYVYEKYGPDHVAMICTFTTFRARSAVREIARTYGLTHSEIGRVTSFLPHFHAGDIKSLADHMPECRDMPIYEEPWRSIVEMAEAVDGYPRHLSIHSGGVVISRPPLTDMVPLERSTKGIVITQYDMGPVEQLGLIKMDLLGHRSLTVIADTVRAVKAGRGIEIDVYRLPEPDPLTADLLREGRTVGCFQIESPAMRSLLKSLRAETTMDLVKGMSLIRPGPSGSGMKERYIARRLGEEPTTYLHPKLGKLLNDTYGVMLYQEDILKVASAVADMTMEEADSLRRAMSKNGSREDMARHSRRFVEGAAAAGVDKSAALEIWRQIANFSEYSYCKAHAATYGELAYRCAYLKAHYPTEFLAGVLTNRGGFYHTAAYIEEARRHGVRIAGPDVNSSARGYTTEGRTIRVGLDEVRDLTHRTIDSIFYTRGNRAFINLTDFLRRTCAGRTETESLIRAGAFDSIGPTRPELLWTLKLFYKHVAAARNTVNANELPLDYSSETVPIPHVPNYSRGTRIGIERHLLGFCITDHPIMRAIPRLSRYPLVASVDLHLYDGMCVCAMGWVIADRVVGLKGRGCMKFITMEDAFGLTEVVLFPKVYQRYGHLLRSHGPFIVTGTVDAAHNSPSLVAESITMNLKPVVERGA